jgi:Protein of unknown function (DUF3750)
MSFAASSGLLLLGLLVLPVLVSGCLSDGRNGVPWYEARRDPTGLAPDPVTVPEAVVQVYAARAVSWRGIISVHTWIAVKPSGARRYTRYEVLGFGVANGAPAVRVDRMGPDNYWFGARPQIILDRRGPGVDAMIEGIRAAVVRYPIRTSTEPGPAPTATPSLPISPARFQSSALTCPRMRSARISCREARCLPRRPAARGFRFRSTASPASSSPSTRASR